jgi:hypothetical protein
MGLTCADPKDRPILLMLRRRRAEIKAGMRVADMDGDAAAARALEYDLAANTTAFFALGVRER